MPAHPLGLYGDVVNIHYAFDQRNSLILTDERFAAMCCRKSVYVSAYCFDERLQLKNVWFVSRNHSGWAMANANSRI